MQLKAYLLLLTVTFLGVSQLNPLFPREQWLQHTPTAIAICVLAYDIRKNWLTRSAYLCVIAFLWLHILGARYIYSCVPYDAWYAKIFGVTLSQVFGFERNHYDRLVHFLFGWLMLLASTSIIGRSGSIRGTWNLCFAFCVVTTFSGVYEVFEWFLTIVMASHDAIAYNGQQGDNWDAQKDMGLAILGSLLALPFARLMRSPLR